MKRHRPPPTRYGPAPAQPKGAGKGRGAGREPPPIPDFRVPAAPRPGGAAAFAAPKAVQLAPVPVRHHPGPPAPARAPARSPAAPTRRGTVQRTSTSSQAPQQVQQQAQLKLRVKQRTVDVELDGSFLRLDRQVASEAYIYDSQVRLTQTPNLYEIGDRFLEDQVADFLAGNLVLYRGIAHWHPLYPIVAARRTLRPLGAGRLPDTSTVNTKFIPFSPDRMTARMFSKAAASGFNSGDKMEFVVGYDPRQANFDVGITISVAVTMQDGVGFINSSEIQIAGPVAYGKYQIDLQLTMGSLVSDLYTGTPDHRRATRQMGQDTLGSSMPDPPTVKELMEYRKTHGNLRHGTAILTVTGLQWVPDSQRTNCSLCNRKFSFTWRKHHCRVCGDIFCSSCSSGTARVRDPLTSSGHDTGVKEVRVCDRCLRNH